MIMLPFLPPFMQKVHLTTFLQVTVFGQSAGGQSVLMHVLAQESGKYYRRAISQSPPGVFQHETVEEAQWSAQHLIDVIRKNEGNKECEEETSGMDCLMSVFVFKVEVFEFKLEV